MFVKQRLWETPRAVSKKRKRGEPTLSVEVSVFGRPAISRACRLSPYPARHDPELGSGLRPLVRRALFDP